MKSGTAQCPICSNSKNNKVLYIEDASSDIQDLSSLPENRYIQMKCSKCKVLFLDSDIDEDFIYKKFQLQTCNNMEEWSKKMIYEYEEPRKTAFQENIMKIKNFLIKDKPCLLDVGCSLGTFMSIAQKEGWDVFGVELHPIFYKYVASKFKDRVYHGQFPNIISSGKKFDIITLFEVLEHSTRLSENP